MYITGDGGLPRWPSSLQSLSHVRLFATQQNATGQASLFITNTQRLLKLMSIESVMPSNHLILCCPLLLLTSIFPSIRVFSNESVFESGGQSIGVSASASVLPMNIQDWFALGLTGLISLQSKSLPQHHGSKASILWCSVFFMMQLSHPCMITGKTIALTRQILVGIKRLAHCRREWQTTSVFLPWEPHEQYEKVSKKI